MWLGKFRRNDLTGGNIMAIDKEPGKTNCKWCGCIPGVSEFDPLFFEISPREAETMDPRQRFCSRNPGRPWRMPDMDRNRSNARKSGCLLGLNKEIINLTQGEGNITSNNNAILAARLAYFLNLNGPVMAIDTACSSGLVAAHQAVLSLRNGECDTAISSRSQFVAHSDFIYRDESSRDVIGGW